VRMSRTVKKITIFVHNPREVEKRTEFEETVSSLLEVHPEARLTWLQSSASWSTEDGAMGDEHVLTCVAEYDVGPPSKPAGKRR
jgi:hypothetical protein